MERGRWFMELVFLVDGFILSLFFLMVDTMVVDTMGVVLGVIYGVIFSDFYKSRALSWWASS